MARIMVIDDDVEFADYVSSVLCKAGHEVSVIHSTEDAVDILEKAMPDLVVLDVMFPGNPAGGFDLARRIRFRKGIRALPILLLTAINKEFPVEFSKNDIDPDWMPVQDFVEKPVDSQQLLNKVRRLLERASG